MCISEHARARMCARVRARPFACVSASTCMRACAYLSVRTWRGVQSLMFTCCILTSCQPHGRRIIARIMRTESEVKSSCKQLPHELCADTATYLSSRSLNSTRPLTPQGPHRVIPVASDHFTCLSYVWKSSPDSPSRSTLRRFRTRLSIFSSV